MIFEVEQRIEAPVDRVWRHLSDPALMAAWMAGVEAMRSADGRPLALGSRLLFQARGAERTREVVAFEAGRQLDLRSVQGPITATYSYRLTPEGKATHVALAADCVAKGPAVLLTPLLRPLIRRADSGQLRALAEAVAAPPDDQSPGGGATTFP